MAKITNRRADHTLPSLSGRLIFATWKGRLYVRAWPKRKGPSWKARFKPAIDWFKDANLLAKYPNIYEHWTTTELSRSGPLYPRDFTLAALAGNLFQIELDNGEKWYSMATVKEISNELDAIAQLPGQMMIRGETLWIPVSAGSPGQVLQADPSPTFASWIDPSFPKGGLAITDINRLRTDTSPHATKGWFTVASRDTRILAFEVSGDWISGATYFATIGTIVGNQLKTIEAQTSVWTAPSSAFDRVPFEFSSPVLLSAGTQYCFLVTRSDSTPTAVLQLSGALNTLEVSFPHKGAISWVYFDSTNPQVNDFSAAQGFDNPPTVNLIYSIVGA